MIAQIITENGQKKIKPLTADAGAGNPVGTIIPMYKKSSPSGYLYCDGSTFDETQYPLLYAYLGSNVLPDYRECAIVGAEQNTTDTIANHDVYTQGQFKDDQLQNHGHSITDPGHTHSSNPSKVDSEIMNGGSQTRFTMWNSGGWGNYFNVHSSTTGITIGNPNSGTHGDVTRGKRKAVYFYIKATSGLSENAQDNVVAQLNEERSYSTSEVNTGKKWIDGKPIYKKTFVINHTANQQYSLETLAQDIDFIAKVEYATNKITIGNHTYQIVNNGTWDNIGGNTDYQIGFLIDKDETNQTLSFSLKFGNSIKPYTFDTWVTLEYTKTTD